MLFRIRNKSFGGSGVKTAARNGAYGQEVQRGGKRKDG